MRLGVLLLLSGLLAGPTALLQAADQAPAPNPTLLIERLGSFEFSERQDAMRLLNALGEPALPALKASLRSDDVELRRRCEELIARIERRLESARAVSPKRVQLTYKDTPLAEAIADFNRKSGYTIELGGDTAKFAGRRITLDTPAVTFWEALDQFCEKAGLIEVGLVAPADAPKTPTVEDERMLQRQQILWARGGVMTYNPYQQATVDLGKIVLVDGTPPALPGFRSTAVRVRLLPKHVPVYGSPGGNDEKTLPLEITPEPGLPWLGLVSIRVDRALDEHGQTLVQPSLFLAQLSDLNANPYAQAMLWNGNLSYYPYQQQVMGNPNHAPIRLRMAEKPTRMVKELEGLLTCQVQTPLEPLIAVENVLKAAGTTAEGVDGGTIKVVDVKRETNGQVKLKVVIQAPGQDADFMGGFGVGRAVRINMAVMKMRVNGVQAAANAGNLELRDDRGVPFQLVSAGAQQQAQVMMAGQGVVEQELVFQPNAAQGSPAKLVYLGRRTVTVEVPFSLKDLPLQ
jgi:hypothetical protein